MPKTERWELVRVDRELVERLLAGEPKRVMLVGLERFEDGTVELVFRTPDDRGAISDRDALRLMLSRLLDVALVDGYGETVADEASALLTTTGGKLDG